MGLSYLIELAENDITVWKRQRPDGRDALAGSG